MKVWITKYAFTKGIQIVEGRISNIGSGSMFCYRQNGYDCSAHGEGRDWHRTQESAIRRVEAMRVNKIASLKKSIAKLEAKSFR